MLSIDLKEGTVLPEPSGGQVIISQQKFIVTKAGLVLDGSKPKQVMQWNTPHLRRTLEQAANSPSNPTIELVTLNGTPYILFEKSAVQYNAGNGSRVAFYPYGDPLITALRGVIKTDDGKKHQAIHYGVYTI